MIPRCCICGRSVRNGGYWNGWTDKDYCYSCAAEHMHDGEPEIVNGQMLLEVQYD